jgi:hypothetical protein
MAEGEKISVEEPMALISIVRHFEKHGFTIDRNIRIRMQSLKGQAFEEAVLLSCTQLFRQGTRLDEVFQFHGETPVWARQEAQIVCRKDGGDIIVFDIPGGEPELLSAGVSFYAKDLKAVQNWLELIHAVWCFPSHLIGPDLMAWLRLKDARLLLLLIQAKCYLTGNIASLDAEVTAYAIRQLSPTSMTVCMPSSLSLFSTEYLFTEKWDFRDHRDAFID